MGQVGMAVEPGTSAEHCPSVRGDVQPPGTVWSSISHEPSFFLITLQ